MKNLLFSRLIAKNGMERVNQHDLREKYLGNLVKEELQVARSALGPVSDELEWHSIHRDIHRRWVVLQMPKKPKDWPRGTKYEPQAMMGTFVEDAQGLRILSSHQRPDTQYAQIEETPVTDPRLKNYVLRGIKNYSEATAKMHRAKPVQ